MFTILSSKNQDFDNKKIILKIYALEVQNIQKIRKRKNALGKV